MSPPSRSDVAGHCVGRQVEGVAVTAGGEHDGVRRVRAELAVHQVAGDDAGAATVDVDNVDHLGPVPELDVAEADLACQLLVGTDQQLLAGLASRIEGAAHLGAAEAAIVEQAAVLACKRHTLGNHLVNDVDRHFVVAPLVGHWAVRDLGIEIDGHSPVSSASTEWVTASGSNSTTPARTAMGNDTFPATISVATPAARPLRHVLNRGLLAPRL